MLQYAKEEVKSMLKDVYQLIACNFKRFVLFQFVYRILTLFLFSPIFFEIVNYVMKISGYTYLTLDNILNFIFDPLVFFLLLICAVLLMMYELFNICVNIIILDASYQKKKVRIRDVLPLAFQKSLQVFHMNNFKVPFLVLFLIPFLHLGVASNLISTISIPEFIMEYIQQNIFLMFLLIIAIAILVITFLRWIYSIHYYVLENCNFKESCFKSKKLSRNNLLKDFGILIGAQLGVSLIYILFLGIEIVLIYMFHHLLVTHIFTKSVIMTIIGLLVAMTYAIFILLATSMSYALISVLFYKHKDEKDEPIQHIQIKQHDFLPGRKKVLKVILLITIVLSGSYYTYGLINGRYNLNIEYIKKIEVTAHRGASMQYPENTMSAFQGAKNQGANWIELDIQQTKDQQIVVFHDHNLKRITGVNKNVYDVNYAFIQSLDAGKHFSQKYTGEKIPLLSDVIDFAKKNNIRLNIELKPSGYEKNFEKQVVDLIKEKDFIHQCVLTSMNYSVLENIKKIDTNITTVYVMGLAVGNITQLDAADCFSIEATSATETMVTRVHNAGKEIYVWTVNNENNISKMTDLNVDNIITDNVPLTKHLIMESQTSNIIVEYMKFVEKYF